MEIKNSKNLLTKIFPRLSVRDVCTLGLLLAITVLLAIFGTFRIGNAIKIPTKFISVFIAASVFGPVWGGLCGALGDVLNALLVPVGPIMPQITLIEFLCGFTYGVFFMSKSEYTRKEFAVTAILCVVVQLLIDMFLTTAVLVSVGYFPGFKAAFWFRLPAGLIKAVLQLVLMLPCKGLVGKIKKQHITMQK